MPPIQVRLLVILAVLSTEQFLLLCSTVWYGAIPMNFILHCIALHYIILHALTPLAVAVAMTHWHILSAVLVLNVTLLLLLLLLTGARMQWCHPHELAPTAAPTVDVSALLLLLLTGARMQWHHPPQCTMSSP
jgi:hypothetical protein